MIWRPAEQIFYNYGYKEKATLRWEVGTRHGLARTHIPGVVIHSRSVMKTMVLIPEESEVQAPCQIPQPWRPATERGGLITPGFENQRGLCLLWESWKAVENWDYVLKGLMYKHTGSLLQSRGSSLKITWIIHEGITLTNFRVSAGRAGISENFFGGENTGGCHYLLLSFTLLCFHLAGPS